jgi:putative FmdB family regulatory protein
MPMFDYACQDCGTTSEIWLRSHLEEALCPHCQSKNLTKKLPLFTRKGPSKRQNMDHS